MCIRDRYLSVDGVRFMGTAEQGVAPREMELELLDALRGAEEERRTTKRRTPVSIWGDMGFLL